MVRTLLSLFLAAAPASAADWSEFRGPQGQGKYVGNPLPTEWGPDKNVTWKSPIPGRGWSSPIAVGGKLYLTTAVPMDAQEPANFSLRALAVDSATGRILWNTEVFVEDIKKTPQPNPKNSHASPTPVSDGKWLWVHFGHLGTACLDLDGNVVWETQTLKYNPVHGNGGSPILVDDLVVFSCDGSKDPFVVALEQQDRASSLEDSAKH